jgi:hypothetical protein
MTKTNRRGFLATLLAAPLAALGIKSNIGQPTIQEIINNGLVEGWGGYVTGVVLKSRQCGMTMAVNQQIIDYMKTPIIPFHVTHRAWLEAQKNHPIDYSKPWWEK